MSLASTVSRVIDVPATHSSGVDRIWPAWTAAISSSRDSNRVPPAPAMNASPGWGMPAGLSDGRNTATRTATPTATRASRRGEASQARAIPTTALVAASRTTTVGEPMAGMSTNGMSRLPRIAPVVLTARSAPDSLPASERSSRSSADAVGKAMPSTIVTGRTTMIADRARRRQGLQRLARVQRLRDDEDTHQAQDGQHRDEQLAQGEDADRVAPTPADEVVDEGADGQAGQERGEDDREHVRRVAGPRGEQTGPRDLVAERGDARDEGDGQGEPDARAAVPLDGGGAAAAPTAALAVRPASATGSVAESARQPRCATSPATSEPTAPMASAPDSPTSSTRTSPARSVPMMAPTVLAAYSRPNDRLSDASLER